MCEEVVYVATISRTLIRVLDAKGDEPVEGQVDASSHILAGAWSGGHDPLDPNLPCPPILLAVSLSSLDLYF